MGVLKWSPDQFWKSTPYELLAALDGHMESLGVKRPLPGMTRARFEELDKQYPLTVH
jgi:hypothetical protein